MINLACGAQEPTARCLLNSTIELTWRQCGGKRSKVRYNVNALMHCSVATGGVRVMQPDDLLCFRGRGATRYELEGVERRGRGVGIEVLAKGEGGYCSVVGAEEVLE